ncbi:hypothetical protein DM2_1425 [Halorubrum sp. DM2]|uniref:hypothetical protein n=1 Tax=Halorubrum sp. DM2 TaxID=2527867 RepID=UPI0024B84E3C|nr:hypothetical protein [Halorubrum sp. DM2]VTT88091.1 hypothetical protein DM2_1425 [Halorubrum sp. DM2]
MSRTASTLREKATENAPPADILGLAAGLVVFGLVSFWYALLVQFSGPVVDGGLSYQLYAGVTWVALGAVFLFLAVRVYQQRSVGWYGTLTVAVLVLCRAALDTLTFGLVPLVYVAIPVVVVAFLLVRRDRFLTS